MIRPISFLRPFFEIRPGERTKTLAMLLYFFLTIALIYILKPVRSALFLDQLGARNLRYVYMGEGLFLILVTAAYVKLSRALPRKVFFIAVLSFFASNLLLFWYLFRIQMPFLAGVFYIWVASFSITMTTQFWLLANDIFNPEEAKRLFGLIISGGSAGGVIGGIMTQQAMRWMKTEELLLVAAGVVAVCALLIALLWNHMTAGIVSADAKPSPKGQSEDVDKPVRKMFLGSSYLVALVGLVVLAKMSSTIVDNQFNRVVEIAISGKEARTAFFGGFMAALNAVSFLTQLVLTSLCLRYLGLGFALAVLPVGLGLLAFPSFLFPVLATGLLLKLYDGSMNYSIQQASKEVLFLPLSRELRYRVKPVIDMLGFRAAKSLAGLYIALCAPLFGLSDERLGVLVLALIPVWLWLAWRMKRGYSKLLREYILNRPRYKKSLQTTRATDVLSFLYNEKAFHEIQDFMNHPSSLARKVASTACLAYARSSSDLSVARRIMKRLLDEELLDHDDAGNNELKKISEHEPQKAFKILEPFLRKDHKTLAVKRQAIELAERIPQQWTVDLLLELTASAEDHGLRFLLARALMRLQDQNPKLTISRGAAKTEIAREAKIYNNIRQMLAFHQENRKADGQDFLKIALEALRDESFERLFFYLDLLYPHEIIKEIYEGIIYHEPKDPVRIHATELLANTLEPDVLILVQRVLDPHRKFDVEEEAVAGSLREIARSGDRWFSVIGFFLAEESGLALKQPEFATMEKFPEFKNA